MGIAKINIKKGIVEFVCDNPGCGITRVIQIDMLTTYMMDVGGEKTPVVRLPVCECGAYSFCVAGPGDNQKSKWRRRLARAVARQKGGIEERVIKKDREKIMEDLGMDDVMEVDSDTESSDVISEG